MQSNVMFPVSAAAVALLAVLLSVARALPASQAACYVNTANAVAQCQYLGAGDMGKLQGALVNISAADATYSVTVSESDGASISDTVFSGYGGIVGLEMQQDGYTAVPAALLGNVGAQLRTLDLSINNIGTISAVAAQYAGALQDLDYSYNGATVVNDDAFAGYTALTSIYLNDNALTAINAPFAGLTSLVLISLSDNSIGSIAAGAFADQGALLYLELNNNRLTTITAGTFDSLTSLVQIWLEGNPFDCTCELQWLKDWLNSRNLLARSKATCATPTVGAFADVEFCPAK